LVTKHESNHDNPLHLANAFLSAIQKNTRPLKTGLIQSWQLSETHKWLKSQPSLCALCLLYGLPPSAFPLKQSVRWRPHLCFRRSIAPFAPRQAGEVRAEMSRSSLKCQEEDIQFVRKLSVRAVELLSSTVRHPSERK
jgi:hypothetical protein